MILILGSAGLVGGHLIEALRDGPEPVRCAVLRDRQIPVVSAAGVEAVCTDVRDHASLARAMKGVRAVINLATVIHERRRGDFKAVLYDGVVNIASAARDAGISRVIHIGALGNAETADDPRYPYLYWKKRGTDYLESAALNHTIFELAVVFGPGDQHLTALALALKFLRFAALPKAIARVAFQPVYVRDLVTAITRSLDDPRSYGHTYPLTGPEVLQYRDLVQLVGAEIGIKPRILHVPEWFVRLALRFGKMLLCYPPVTPELMDLKSVNSVADSSATYTQFGIQPTRVADAIRYLRYVGLQQWNSWRTCIPSHAAFERPLGRRVPMPDLSARQRRPSKRIK